MFIDLKSDLPKQPLHLTADKTQEVLLVGDRIRFLVNGDQTNGLYCSMELTTPSGMGPPPHVHTRETEAFHIVSGRFRFTIGGAQIIAEPGDHVVAPPHIPHRFECISDTPGKMLLHCFPAGLDDFFREAGVPVPADGKPLVPTPAYLEKLVRIASDYGVTMLPPG